MLRHAGVRTLCALLGVALLPACLRAQQEIALAFRPVVGSTPFRCTASYAGVGRSGARVTVTDFKLYVHDLRVELADGTLVPVTLADEAPWQSNGVALLDFEDAAGPCANGTPETRAVVRGTAPIAAAAEVRAVRFTVGVPFAQNHADLAQQRGPLSLTRMFWSWNAGYKFARIDLRSVAADGTGTPVPWMIHLGSTGCTPSGSATAAPLRCAQPNRAEITVAGLDLERDAIAVDLAALLAQSDVLRNTPKTAAGCMSGPTDPDCGPLFAALGLPHPAATARTGAPVFRVAPGAARAEQGAR
ncbi:MAG: metallo-mystery pair system four-Cys motif protein [Gemmatimonadaceae bacterium]|nr:metallo-mystery pair system four-Cys motif protein [Gemmatimonadaceae bacterium]